MGLPGSIALPRVTDTAAQRANDKIRDAINGLLRRANQADTSTLTSATAAAPLFSIYIPVASLATGPLPIAAGAPAYTFYAPHDITVTGIAITRLGAAITAGSVSASPIVGGNVLGDPNLGIYDGDTSRRQDGWSLRVPASSGVGLQLTRTGYTQASGGLVFSLFGVA